MVLKFCSGFFSSETPVLSSSSSATAAIISEERIKEDLKKKALEVILLDVQDAKWEKEFRVFFDGTRVTGLGFRCANHSSKANKKSSLVCRPPTNATSQGASFGSTRSKDLLGSQDSCDDLDLDKEDDEELYQCLVKEIVPNSLAAEYNARCRGIGDYSRLIRENLRVRKVNSDDVAGVPYDQVIQRMRAAVPAFFLTFADISSKRIPISKAAAAAVSLEAPNFRCQQSDSTLLLGSGGSPVIARRNSSVGLSAPLGGLIGPDSSNGSFGGDRLSGPVKRTSITRRNSTSSVVLLHGGGWGARGADTGAGAASALVSDLELKAKDVSDQLASVKQQMADLQREKDRIALEKESMTQECGAIAAIKEKLETERLRLREERDAVIAKNRLLASQRQSASDLLLNTVEQEQREATRLKSELDLAKNELLHLQQAHTQLLGSHSTLQGKMVDQGCICEEMSKLVDDLRHEKEELSLVCKELQLEHSDSSHHAEELHSRLVEAQGQQRNVEKRLGLSAQELDQKTKLLSVLKQGIKATQSISSELDQLLLGRRGEQETSGEITEYLGLLMHLRDEHLTVEKQRDELLVESSRYEQMIQTYEHEVEALTLKSVELRDEIGSLHREIELAQGRERALLSEFESKHLAVQQSSSSTHEELQRQIQSLEKRCEAERVEKEQLRLALDRLEENARARLENHSRDQEFLSQFKQQLVNGIVVTKYGSRGNPHARVLFSDFGCRWISWKPPSSGVSLASPRADAKVETNDLVEVISGATTEVFLRQKLETSAKCLSLVFVHPCRTLDIEADTLEKCQYFLRGFRLLHEEMSQKRRQ